MKKFPVFALFLLLAACATPSVLEQKAPPSPAPTAVPADLAMFHVPKVEGGTITFMGGQEEAALRTETDRKIAETDERYNKPRKGYFLDDTSADGNMLVATKTERNGSLGWYNDDILLLADGKETHIPLLTHPPRWEADDDGAPGENDGYVYEPQFAFKDTQVVMPFCYPGKRPRLEGLYVYDIATGQTRTEWFDDDHEIWWHSDTASDDERFWIGNPGVHDSQKNICLYELTPSDFKRLDFDNDENLFVMNRGINLFSAMDARYFTYCTTTDTGALCLNRIEIDIGAKKKLVFPKIAAKVDETGTFVRIWDAMHFDFCELMDDGRVRIEFYEVLPVADDEADSSGDSSDEDDAEPRVKYAVLSFD